MTTFAASLTIVTAPGSPAPEQPNPPLAQVLRAGTAAAHQALELRLGLPGSIHSLADYQACLLRFYQLYRPLELKFQHFPDWASLGLAMSPPSLSGALAADLIALSVDLAIIPDAPTTALPTLDNFAAALGARYVLEGSALGSQVMLPHLRQTLGAPLDAADSFFRGRGAQTGSFWKCFRTALDLYGDIHPEEQPDVIAGAIATFNAIGLWMRP